MKTLLYKHLRLVCQPMTLVFCLFGVMLLIPAYPYTVMWFYVMLGLFFSFLNGREQKDVYYSALLPIRKRDTVKANCLFVGLIELLALLIAHRGTIFSREEILHRIWSDEVVVLDRTIDVNITRLRRKIGPYGEYIVTRQGYGYGFKG